MFDADEQRQRSVEQYSPERRAPLSGVKPLCTCVQGQVLSSHTWWRRGRHLLVWWLCNPGCRQGPGCRPEQRGSLRPKKWSILKGGMEAETSVGEEGDRTGNSMLDLLYIHLLYFLNNFDFPVLFFFFCQGVQQLIPVVFQKIDMCLSLKNCLSFLLMCISMYLCSAAALNL